MDLQKSFNFVQIFASWLASYYQLAILLECLHFIEVEVDVVKVISFDFAFPFDMGKLIASHLAFRFPLCLWEWFEN